MSKDDLDVPTPAGPISTSKKNLDTSYITGNTYVQLDENGKYISNYTTPPGQEIITNDGVGTIKVQGNLVIEDENGKDVDVSEFIKTMQERMLILQPNFEAMEEHPALKDAYDQYKMLEKLLSENNNAKKD